MLAVYDWVGSLGTLPEHFELSTQPGCAITPDEPVTVVEGKMVHMKVVKDPIPISKKSEEQDATFIGYGPDLCKELPDNTMLDLNVEEASGDVPSKLLSEDDR